MDTDWSQLLTKHFVLRWANKRVYQENIFLISPQKICCGYSLVVPRLGTSNEYHVFVEKSEKYRVFGWKKIKVPYLELWLNLENEFETIVLF